jgi:hypothetical protein
MASFTRSNGLGHAHGTLYSNGNISFYAIDCKATLASQGGIGGAIEAVMQAVNPLLHVSSGTDGFIGVIVDDSQWDATLMQEVVQALGTVNSFNLAVATVAKQTNLFDIADA